MSDKYKIFPEDSKAWPFEAKSGLVEELQKQQYETKLRKMEHIIRAYPGSIDSTIKPNLNSKERIKERLEQQLTNIEKDLENIKQNLDRIPNIKYDVGMAVFHKSMGNAIITNIYLNEMDGINLPVQADFTDGYVYEIVGVQGKFKAREHELIPITELTTNLYCK